MNTTTIKTAFRKFWTFLWPWNRRSVVAELEAKHSKLLTEKETSDKQMAEALALAKLEIQDLNKRLLVEREAKETLQRHVNKMWQFIALRHRIDLPTQQGTIRSLLQEAEGR